MVDLAVLPVGVRERLPLVGNPKRGGVAYMIILGTGRLLHISHLALSGFHGCIYMLLRICLVRRAGAYDTPATSVILCHRRFYLIAVADFNRGSEVEYFRGNHATTNESGPAGYRSYPCCVTNNNGRW